MQRTFKCQGCGQEKPSEPRQKGNQKFCGEPVCQRVRKARWQKNKMQTDTTYHAQQLDCLQRWRKERPLDRYQNQYLQTHAEYVAENRRKQSLRNRKRHVEAPSEMIVKMDALSQVESDTYIMRPLTSEKIVKMDAFVVELKVLKDFSSYSGASPP